MQLVFAPLVGLFAVCTCAALDLAQVMCAVRTSAAAEIAQDGLQILSGRCVKLHGSKICMHF